ncbi:YkgJ family cysteine cluster protein [Luteimonas sp. Y-2-2-4F]|nr:YkgJ family cysteine cluster protein [Luteimonas sp. Y-2-2-4F]MCD9032492.1 YkgJ family cysteine cluster protein [Luteimonas sp. Y-2-2-4F]
MSHPCLSCGACCAHYRVGFHWSEAAPELGGHVPAALAEVLDGHRLAMRGTWAERPRCIALDAEIGVRACCTIHPLRPSVCREVRPSWEDARGPSPQCDRARLAHGLPALAPADWAADRRIGIEVTVLPAAPAVATGHEAPAATLPLAG